MLRLLLLFTCLTPALAQLPPGFVQRQVARNLNPTTVSFAPNGRLFIAEKDGKIREVVGDVLQGDPFMTLPNVDNTNERGLSGLCFHPDFPRTPYVYVYYTVKGADYNRLSRFSLKNGLPDLSSEAILFNFDILYSTIHNAGVLRFGPDRKLYVSLGDGANAPAAQRLDNYLGKVLRMNDDGSVPADNPFVGKTTGGFQTIFALGFRNPFSMDIDPVSGRILVGDVGLDSFEEVNDIRAGRNYGWPLVEGKRTNQTAPDNYADPIYAYDHADACAITGLAIYNPPSVRFPSEYRGRAFFADYCAGFIRVLDPATGQVTGNLVTGIDRPISMITSPDGYLYYLARAGLGGGTQEDNTATSNGSLYKVTFLDAGLPYITQQSVGKLVPVGEPVTFAVEVVGQKPLTFRWFRNGTLIAGASQPQYAIGSPTLADNGASFRCVITNALGTGTSQDMVLRVVQGQRPVARIRQPITGATYRGGSTIAYAGAAVNTSQQPVAGAKLTWWIDFHHDDHTHPALDPVTGPTAGAYTVPRVGETATNVFYRVHLRATDVTGLTSETFADVKPELSTVTIGSKPEGAMLTLDGQPRQAGFKVEAVTGTVRTLAVKPYWATPEGFSQFSGWSNGQKTPSLTYETPPGSGATLTATYSTLPAPGGNGLVGEYFSGRAEFTGTPTVTRIDTTVNFYWGNTSPDPRVSLDNFVARWTGTFEVPFSDAYTFTTQTDDGLRLWIDNKLLIDKWQPQPSFEWSTTMSLTAGRPYSIRMEYQEFNGEAEARLRWNSSQFDKAVISKPYLFGKVLITANEPGTDASLTVFPQPAQDAATIRYVASQPGSAQLDVVDLLGQRLFGQPVRVLGGTNEYRISVADWPAGLYFVSFRTEGGTTVNRRLLVR